MERLAGPPQPLTGMDELDAMLTRGEELALVKKSRATPHRARHCRPPSRPPVQPELTITVIVPAYNEENGIRDTLDALKRQTSPADRVIVVDDCSTDDMPRVLLEYAGFAEVLRPPANLGSKARAQNYALPYCDTDLVLPVDADTVLAPDYIQLIRRPFADPSVVIAAGNVQTKVTRTVTERGRSIEYLYGFHFYRPIQNQAHAPVVCSGCCSAFRLSTLMAFGGFPERTIVEDFDYTWTQQIAGRRAVYVAAAVAYAADPENLKYLSKQMKRWMSGFFQNMRIHWLSALRHKPMLALWAAVDVFGIVTAPLWWAGPLIMWLILHVNLRDAVLWWAGMESALLVPPLAYACARRKINPAVVFMNVPFIYVNKMVNTYHALRAMFVELVLVPLGRSEGLTIYEKGR